MIQRKAALVAVATFELHKDIGSGGDLLRQGQAFESIGSEEQSTGR